MKTKTLVCLFFFFIVQAYAQTEESGIDSLTNDNEGVLVIPPLNEQLKVGIKFGTGATMMLGEELQNPRLSYMISGGAYLRYRFAKHLSLQPELNISFRGSNFANGNNQYSKIVMYYIDLPVLFMYGFNEKNTSNLLAGFQYCRLLNSSLYLTNEPTPVSSAPKFKNNDLMAVLGAQFHTPFIGFQLAAKYGLIDLNNGLLPNLNPTNTGKDIHQFVVELNVLF